MRGGRAHHARIVQLSGGQVQRAGAARMFVRQAELYVIDDLNSALDQDTERQLWERIDATRPENETTYLIVSHRPAALLRADRILTLRSGRLEPNTSVQ